MARKRKGKYRSQLERDVAKILRDCKVPFVYEKEAFKYEIVTPLNNTSCGECGSTRIVTKRTYTPDFFIPVGHGTVCILEAKGRFTAQDRNKMLAVKDQYPQQRFLMVFQRNNPIYRGSKTKYLDWCGAKGLEAIMVTSLKEWLKDEGLR